jgi:DNA-binding SARP family transcriptional activator
MSSLHLQTLGTLCARHEDGSAADRVTARPRLIALLVHASIEAPDGWLATDAVTSLLWPDAEARRARRLLSQLLYEAAAELGFALVERRRNAGLRLVPGAVRCDAAELLHGDVDAAWVARHAAGELLPGFVSGAGYEFDDWLDRTRTRVRQRAVSLLVAGAAAEPRRAVEYARLANRLEPWNAAAATSLIRALGAAGAQPEAGRVLEAYRACVRELDMDPPRAVVAELLRVCGPAAFDPGADRAAGIRPSPPSPDAGAGDIGDPGLEGEPEAAGGADVAQERHAGMPGRPSLVRAAVALLAFAAMGLTAVLWQKPRMVTADASTAWAADLVVHTGEAHHAWNAVVAPELMARLRQGGMQIVVGVTRDVAAPFALTGALSADAGEIRGNVRLLDMRSGALLGTWRLATTASDLAGVAGAIADSIRTSMARASMLSAWRGSRRAPAAVSALARARAEYDGAHAAIREGATAVGDARLAAADSLAGAAAALEPAWPEPHLQHALVLEHRALRAMAFGDHAAMRALIAAAIGAADRAVRSGGSVASLERLGALSSPAWRMGALPGEDARAAAQADLEMATYDPGASAVAWSGLSSLHAAAGRHADAYAAALEALHRDVFGQRTEHVLMRLFATAFDSGRDTEARQWCAEAARRSPGKWHTAQCRLITLAFRSDVQVEDILNAGTDLSRETPELAASVRPLLELLRAAVLASNGFEPSARRIVADIEVPPDTPSDLLYFAAKAYAQLGEGFRARELLDSYMRNGPPSRTAVAHGRWFTALP